MPRKGPAVSKPNKSVVSKGTTKRQSGDPKSWTIAVFMVGEPELVPSLSRDLLEIERAGSSDAVNVVLSVQMTARHAIEWSQIPLRTDGSKPRKRELVGKPTQGYDLALDFRLDEFLEFVATHAERSATC